MVKLKYYVEYSEGSVTYKVRYFVGLEEAQRVSDELEGLCCDLLKRRLITGYHFHITCR